MAEKAKPKEAKLVAISVKLPPELLQRIRAKSAETGVPTSFVVRKALEEWVEKK